MATKKGKTRAEKAATASKKRAQTKATTTSKTHTPKTSATAESRKVPVRVITSLVFLCSFVLFLVIFFLPEGAIVTVLGDFIHGLIGQVGFAPQFTCAYPMLTVEESIQSALDIAVADSRVKESRLEHILGVIGLSEHRIKLVSSLSGGQLRRLGLGIELANTEKCVRYP